MRTLYFLLLSSLAIFFSHANWAWQVEVSSDKPSSVLISNTEEVKQLEVYLIWFDLDGESKKLLSWTVEEGWQNRLQPVVSTPIDLPKSAPVEVTTLDQACEAEHRCFLGFIAVEPDHDPTLSSNWQHVSLLPLTLAASQERLPGQSLFLSSGDNGSRYYPTDNYAEGAPTSVGAAPPSADKAEDSSSGEADVEKPDIFQLVGSQLLYANSQAKRFQVIDVSDPAQPKILAWTKLTGIPQELYVINNHYVIMQNDYSGKTFLTVFSQTGTELTQTSEVSLKGRLKESRRRNSFIYTVASDYEDQARESITRLNMLQVTPTGELSRVDVEEVRGNTNAIAIFSNYLVIGKQLTGEWGENEVQVFDLTDESKIHSLPSIKLPGRIPSEFHLHVANQKLHVVYEVTRSAFIDEESGDKADQNGTGAVEESGSTLAIYDLVNQQLLGKVTHIAPGESLFATRFAGEKAYVVTYERVDPLWVIDIRDPRQPKILGELKVPGWSEKMFFHNDRLFAVGIHDQPEANEPEDKRVRRLAMSLFDVSDPTKPDILSRFIPLVNQVDWSYSPALQDERALLLEWQNQFAALPVESWETDSGSHLQMVSFANDQLKDAGVVDSPVRLQRSLRITEQVLAALSDQSLYTIDAAESRVLGEVELGANLSWLRLQNGDIWVAARGNKGYSRIYRYAPNDLEQAVKVWKLPRGYEEVQMGEKYLVLFDYNPLALQVLDLATEQLQSTKTVETDTKADTKRLEIPEPTWFHRDQGLVHQQWFYIAEQRAFEPKAKVQGSHLPRPEEIYQTPEWVLRAWHLPSGQEATARSIPGLPVGFTTSGLLVTRENLVKGGLRLNLLNLTEDSAKLVNSYPLNQCQNHLNTLMEKDKLYVNCQDGNYYYPEPIMPLAEPGVKAEQTEGGDSDVAPPSERWKTHLTQLIVESGNFKETSHWTWSENYSLIAVDGNSAIMQQGGWLYPMMDVVRPTVMPTEPYESNCVVYQLSANAKPTVLKEIDGYCSQQATDLSENQAWFARGFEGIETIGW